jgi:hypothetical protein
MGNLLIESDFGVPRIVCTDCGKCDSVMGKSLCSIVNRGCCHYFPEFSLADIHRMVVQPGGMDALNTILGNPGTIVNNYNIYARGYFDKAGYEAYLNSGNLLDTGTIKDHTIFFRACPFVEPGSGCMLPPRFRTTVCNFFICSEVIGKPEFKKEFDVYIDERTRYSRWMYRESTELQHILTEHGINLSTNFQGTLEVLKGLSLNLYEFPALAPVEY